MSGSNSLEVWTSPYKYTGSGCCRSGCSHSYLLGYAKKAGNSNTQERINLIEQFISHFGSERIQCLTADREFRGQDWVCFLKQNNIPFCIRIPTNTQVFNRYQNKKLPVKRLFSLKLGESMVLNQCFFQHYVWIIVARASSNKFCWSSR